MPENVPITIRNGKRQMITFLGVTALFFVAKNSRYTQYPNITPTVLFSTSSNSKNTDFENILYSFNNK